MIGCLTETTTCVVAKPLVLKKVIENRTPRCYNLKAFSSLVKIKVTRLHLTFLKRKKCLRKYDEDLAIFLVGRQNSLQLKRFVIIVINMDNAREYLHFRVLFFKVKDRKNYHALFTSFEKFGLKILIYVLQKCL